jgi:multidrug efflux pump subunit AcrA (membrane-fusion protein)
MPQPKPARKRPPKKRRRRRATTRRGLPFVPFALGAATVAAVVVAVLSIGSDSQATTSERIVTVSQGVVQSIVSGSGNLEPANQLNVNFGTSGRITKIYVEEGDHVSKGDLLAKLDNASQRVDLAQAQAQLVDAQDALTKAEDASTASTADTSSDTGTTVAVAAQVTPTVTASPTPTPSATPSATPTPRASATPTPAQAPSRSSGSGGSGGNGNNSSSGGGSSTQSVESASAAVQSAELAVQQAQDALDATTLRAPTSGTVASISNSAGDTVGGSQTGAASSDSSSSSAFIVLAQLSKLKLQVALSESDIGKVEVGQKATVTINAASGEEVAAHVSDIGILSSASDSSSGQGNGSTSSSGAVSYPVTVTLDQTTDGVRAGMSATADIITSQASGVVVPNQALRGSTVTLVANGERTTQRVQTGVVGDSATQVVSGLRAGDRVVITSTSAAAGGASSGAGQNRLGGGGFGGGGFGGGGFGGPPGAGGGGGGFRRGG